MGLRKTIAILVMLDLLHPYSSSAQNAAPGGSRGIGFTSVQIVMGSGGLPGSGFPENRDNQLLNEFLNQRKDWDDRFASTKQVLPFVDLAISSSEIIPAPIYEFGKIVIGQQLDALYAENKQLEGQYVKKVLSERNYDYRMLALNEKASKDTGNPQFLDDEFLKQTGLSSKTWDALTREEKDDALLTILEKHGAAIGDVESSIDDLTRSFTKLDIQRKGLQKQLNTLQHSTDAIVQFLKDQQSNDLVLRTTTAYFAGQINGVEFQNRLSALHVPQKDIDNLKSKENVKALERTLQNVVYVGAITNKMFPDSDFARVTGQIASAASVALGLVMKAAEGDYLGAIVGVLGLAGGGEDPNAAIFAQLNKLMEEVRQIRKEMWEYHADLVNRIDALHELDAATLEAVNIILQSGSKNCSAFFDSRPRDAIDPVTGNFRTFSALKDHFISSDNSEAYTACRKEINLNLWANENGVRFFGEPPVENAYQKNKAQAAVSSFYQQMKAYTLLTEYYEPDLNLRVGQLLFPSLDYRSLQKKLQISKIADSMASFKSIPPHSGQNTVGRDERFFYRYFFRFISAPVLLKYVDFEIRLAPYSDFVISGDRSRLLTQSEAKRSLLLLRPKESSEVEKLKRALDLVELALAQQTWLAGDAMLPTLDEYFFQDVGSGYDPNLLTDDKATPKQIANDIDRRALIHLAVGQHNPLLLQNVVRYEIYRNMDAKQYDSFAYAYASSQREDSQYMKTVVGNKLLPVWESDPSIPETGEKLPPGWYTTVPYFDASTASVKSIPFIPLPSTEDVEGRSFAVSSDLQRLFEAREQLKSILLGYEFVRFAGDRKDGLQAIQRLASYTPKER